MEKRCFLAGRKESLFKQLVASLLRDATDDLELYENKSVEFGEMLSEIKESKPDMIILEESEPFTENSLLTRILIQIPEVPLIVISEDSNLIHIVRCQARLLSSSNDLIETINLMKESPTYFGRQGA